ncbi:tripartite tricarboxylate transporter permease [Crossiella sp. CA198]|uniref:tripartite tricarboxylate transporter permease n=1 Tax=Crossiella sp. CA198 TaxID=3455607 RepID=UPI003F8D0882
MSTFDYVIQGFAAAVTPENLLFALLGVLLGTLVGVLPGIGPAMTVALLLPITYSVPPAAALILFAGVLYGGMYGGSTTSILLNTPGESASVITALEGNKMARAGRGAQALATAAIGSFVAGTIGTVLLALLAPQVADWAVHLTSADYFALTMLAFCTVATMLGGSAVRGFAALALGLALGLVGLDPMSSQERFTMGVGELANGVDLVIAAVGLFAVGEALYTASRLRHGTPEVIPVNRVWWLPKEDLKRSWKPWLRGAALGFPLGAVPAGGPVISTFLSYAVEKKLTKHPEEFGKGAIEGVAGPEAANNAGAAGMLVPLLTLGLPTSATAAVMLAAFGSYSIEPGPLLFQTQPLLVWTLIASLYLGNVMLLVLNLPLVGIWVKILRIPRPYLYAGILVCASLGAYAGSQQYSGLLVLLALGVAGLAMRRYGWPVLPAILGLVLGPIAEENLRKALQVSQGDPGVLVASPFAKIVLGLAVLSLLVPLVLRGLRAARARSAAPVS